MLIMICPICGTELRKEDVFESLCCPNCGYLWVGGGEVWSDE
jgi:Zn-finger nucleic acid-binding protein